MRADETCEVRACMSRPLLHQPPHVRSRWKRRSFALGPLFWVHVVLYMYLMYTPFGLHACRSSGVKVRGAKEDLFWRVCKHCAFMKLVLCTCICVHVDNGAPALVNFFRICMMNTFPQHMRWDLAPVDPSESDHCGRRCIVLQSILQSHVVICSFPSIVSVVCGIQNCYHCVYQRFTGYSLHGVRPWVYSVRERARAAAQPSSGGLFASVRASVAGSPVVWLKMTELRFFFKVIRRRIMTVKND